jgi:formamidopyrimidine-DNA glycosylase
VPELPEVETIVRELRPSLVGCRIARVRVGHRPLRRPWQPGWSSRIAGRKIASLSRRGKWIVMSLDRGQAIVIHLGMTGQLRVLDAKTPRAKHTHLVFDLDRGNEQLRFRDVRRFGSASVFEEKRQVRAFFQDALGPEPFRLDSVYWRARLRRANRPLKALLLDQTVVAGVGNIYADESLFEAGLHPARRAATLKPAEAERLRVAIGRVLSAAIARRGSSIRDYVGGRGDPGSFQSQFRVYGRAGELCRHCHTPIERIRLAGRSTHYCPRCQRPPCPLRLALDG